MSILLVLCLCASSYAFQIPDGIEKYSNTLIRNDSRYYTIYSHFYTTPITIENSSSITNWPNAREAVISSKNAPRWATTDDYPDLDINVIADKAVRIYFTAKEISNNGKLAIGVAFAEAINVTPREYNTLNNPILSPSYASNFTHPSLVLTTSSIILTFNNETDFSQIMAVSLTDDGLSPKTKAVPLVQPSLPWEGKTIKNHWGMEKNGYVYIFYETFGGLGVARSSSASPLGPYEKLMEPLLTQTRAMPSRYYLQNALQWNDNEWPTIQL